ncbi:MAG: DNA methyltransferase, partial [Spirochaetia bacterium]
METVHTIQISDARNLSGVENATVDLVVTSPPYPMIKMWDALFSALSEEVEKKLSEDEGDHAFELMHRELDKVWKELFRVTKPGSFVCINIGDATRTVGGAFQLYSNHARIIQGMKEQGFDSLPLILWRKQTNAPNKFMGSGLLPA